VTDPDLPPDLAALDRELAARERMGPSAALRGRVLDAVRRELRRERGPAWRFASVAAAVALLLANLSLSVANDTNWPLIGGPDPERLEATAGRLRALAPELPEREVYRQALAAQAGAWPAPAPALPAEPALILRDEERRAWVTH
jgi:hypothetical protein